MTSDKLLTENDRIAYYAIEGFIKDHGYPPSVRDLCRMTGKKSSATIQYRLKSLEQKGYIKITHGEKRSIRIMKGIEGTPTVDAVEVVHGRWIMKQEPITWCEDDVDVFWECSICQCRNFGESPYCPNCGAKMDGDGNG